MCKLSQKSRQARKGRYGARLQTGVTLMEAMISLALGLVVTTAMVTLMGNTMGSATRIIEMSQLTDELRTAMSMMSRDVRRANYNTNAIYCYANVDCGVDGSASQYDDITITGGSCFVFGLDRDWNGDATDDGPGGFRRATTGDVGVIEMWTGDGAPNCGSVGGDWLPVTDPDFVDITEFGVDDAGSFENAIAQPGGGTLTQRTRQINLQIEGRLILDNGITRRIEDTINIRNNFFNL